MADTKISAAADIATLVTTDMVPVARSGDSSAYHATMSEVATFVASKAGGVTSWNTRTGAVTLTTADVTTALTYTPYNSTNPAGYQTAADVTTALVPYALLASPTFTGTPTLPTGAVAVTQTKGNNTTALATTAFVLANAGAGGASITVSDTPPGSPTSGALWWDSVGGQLYLWYVDANSSQWVVANNGGVTPPAASTTTPSMDGTAAVGTGTTWARADHVHPSDTTKAPLAAPVFTGDARAVTPAVGDNDTSIATTAFVQSAVALALNNVGRNRLHNGGFRINQRTYVSGTALGAAAYAHDRWKAGAGGCTYTFSATPPSTTITITAGTLQQVVEALETEGGTYTLSWTGTAQGRVNAGSYAASPITVTGLAANTAITIEFNAGTVGQAQLEVGAVATPFERQPVQQETAKCERFYQIGSIILVLSNQTGGVSISSSAPMRTVMRGPPTVTQLTNSNGNIGAVTYAVSPATSGFGAIQASATVTAAGQAVISVVYGLSADL